MKNEMTQQIAELVRPSLAHLGVELVGIQWSGLGRGAVLRLVIDREGGATLDDCERVSKAAGAVLDAYDPIDSQYRLEVSSPGEERPLRSLDDWRNALGRRVNVRLRSGDGERVVEGRLVSVSSGRDAAGGAAEIETRDKRRTRLESVALDDLIAARIVVDI
jgi:ribosome maturation factor RimP